MPPQDWTFAAQSRPNVDAGRNAMTRLGSAANREPKKENAGAAVDRTHHQRECHPERRSDSSAPLAKG